MLNRLEDRLFWWLWSRWRKRASTDDLESHISWTQFEVKLRRYNTRTGLGDELHARLVAIPPISRKK
jgi:hypothetical protein